jgi:CBS domain-containing protein
MTRKGLKRLAVLNSDNEVVGIVTRADLIRAYVRPDAEIAGEIRQMLAVLPAPLSGLAVEVLDGVAVLSGDVETSAEARAVIRIVGGIEGVARVRNDLDWEVASELGDNPYSGYPLEGAQV